MPVRRVLNSDLEATVKDLEVKHRVVSVTRDGDGAFVILYEPRGKRTAPGDTETRS